MSSAIPTDNVRDRILKARLHVAVVPVPGVVWECLAETEPVVVLDSTPPKTLAAEKVPTPGFPEADRARVVHFLKQPPQTMCPHGTPVRLSEEERSGTESPSRVLLQQVSAILRASIPPAAPQSSPDKEESNQTTSKSSPSALLQQAALCLQVEELNVEAMTGFHHLQSVPRAQVLLPPVLEEKPTFESAKKQKKARRVQKVAQKENGATTTTTIAKQGKTKDTTPIAKRTRNRKVGPVTTRVK